MQRSRGKKVIIIALTAISCALDLLFAQGRIFPDILPNSQLAKPIFDGSYYLCLPGVVVAMSIWGYNFSRTVPSDFFIIAVNTALYSLLIILMITGARHALRFVRSSRIR